MPNERTLVLFKPDAVEKQVVGNILSRFEQAGFSIGGIKMMQLEFSLLEEHYSHIVDKPFFPNLLNFMTRRPVIALILQGKDVVAKVRELLGPTNPQAADPGTIRGDFGTDSSENICHASDSVENAQIEISRFFKEEEIF